MTITRTQNILKRKCNGTAISYLKLTQAFIVVTCIGFISIMELRGTDKKKAFSALDAENQSLKHDIAFHKKFIFEDTIWVVYEGINEARSGGSYTVKVYENHDNGYIDDFITGLVITRDGGIEKVWISDFNRNGDPEIIVNTQCAGSGGYGHIDRYELSKDKLINKPIEIPTDYIGYRGKDDFSIIEGKLNREFPLYNDDDYEVNPTAGRKILDFDFKKEKWVEIISK